MMTRSHAVLPLSRASTTRLLPWIIGIMVYLAAVMFAAAMMLAGAAADWNRDLSSSLTVQIPPQEGDANGATEERTQIAVEALRAVPGIESVQVVPVEETVRTLEPWLGTNLNPQDLPLPQVIDVKVTQDGAVDLEAVSAALLAAVPDAALDSHDYWRGQIVALVRALEVLAVIIIALIGFCAVAAVVFATRGGVAAHRDVIEVLHLIGATDAFVAKQFQQQAFRTALFGSLAGTLLAALTLFAIGRIAAGLDSVLLPSASLAFWQWSMLALVPVFASAIATATARRTVLGALRRMT